MKNKKWLLSAVLGATLVAFGCSDDSGKKSNGEDEPTNNEPVMTYSLTCAAPSDCNLTLNPDQTGAIQSGQVRIQLSGKSDEADAITELIKDAPVNVTVSGTGFTIQNGSTTATLNTDFIGQAVVNVTPDAAGGNGTITFTTSEEFGSKTVTFNVTVNAPTQEEPPIVEPPKDHAYNIQLSYNGEKDIKYGEVLLFANGSCDEIVKNEMTSDEVADLGGEDDSMQKRVVKSVSDVSFDFTRPASDNTVYAVFARGTNSGVGVAFGCTDGLGPDNENITVSLKDSTVSVVIDPDDPDKPDIPVPEDTDLFYGGTYALTSQFNALSLLPHAPKNASGTVTFQNMLLGDWIEFALNVLSNPAKAVPNILTQQLLPLLIDAEWFRKLVASVAGDAIASMLTPELVDSLLESLGGKTIIENFLNQFTSQLTWWDTATGSIELVNQLVTNFTLRGAFDVPSVLPDQNGNIDNIRHRYLRILYHNGNFDKCYVGQKFGETADRSSIICSIRISDIGDNESSAGSVSGSFTGKFKNIDTDALTGTIDIPIHSLNLSYGRLIYGVIMEFLPMITKMDAATAPKTLGKLVAHYIGMGLVAFWNKQNAENPDAQLATTLTGCAAVGEVAHAFIVQKLGSNETFGTLLGMFANGATLGSLCETGVAKLDEFIDSQLDKLSVSGEAVSFESNNCNLYFGKKKQTVVLTNFGVPRVWGSTVEDKRCNWHVSIATSDNSSSIIDGKFAAGDDK